MTYIGDFRLGDTLDIKFCTVNTSGVPTTLAGTPVISAYPGNSTTEITAGITLTVDFDARTGMHNVRVVASGGNGYATATNYALVITTGTVGGSSVVGYVIGHFSIENRSALMPTTAARTLDVASTGEAGLDYANVNLPLGGIPALGIVDNGTLQSATGTTAVLRAAASFGNSRLVGAVLLITGGTGVGQSRVITAYVDATDTATVDTWDTTPDNTSTYVVFAGAPASTSSPIPANAVQISGDTVAADNAESFFDGTGYAGTNNVMPTVGTVNGLANNAITAASINNGALTNAKFAAGAIDAAATANDFLAEVNAEVVDALNVDTYAEPGQEAPGATISLAKKIGYIFKFLRNKITQTSTTFSVYNDDAVTVDQKASVSDDGTTFTRGEIGSGP